MGLPGNFLLPGDTSGLLRGIVPVYQQCRTSSAMACIPIHHVTFDPLPCFSMHPSFGAGRVMQLPAPSPPKASAHYG